MVSGFYEIKYIRKMYFSKTFCVRQVIFLCFHLKESWKRRWLGNKFLLVYLREKYCQFWRKERKSELPVLGIKQIKSERIKLNKVKMASDIQSGSWGRFWKFKRILMYTSNIFKDLGKYFNKSHVFLTKKVLLRFNLMTCYFLEP